MESIPARSASLVGSLHVCADDRITDRTFTLPSQSTLHVAPKGDEAFNDAAGAEDDDLNRPKPRLPILF